MLKKALVINILVFAAYVLLIAFNSASADKGFNIAIGMGMCVVAQVGLNGAAGIFSLVLGKGELGRALLISAGILMPVGFVTWLILLSIFG